MNELLIRKSEMLKNLNKDRLLYELFTTYSDAVFIINLLGEFIDFNRSLETLIGYSKESILYSHFTNYIYDEDLVRAVKCFNRILNGNGHGQEIELRVVHKTEGMKYVNLTVNPIEIDREILGVYGVAKDVSDQKILEQALIKSESRFAAIIQHSSDVITILDQNGFIQYESPSIEKMLGYMPESTVGTHCLDRVHFDDVKIAACLFEEVNDNPGLTKKAELRVRKSDGAWLWCEICATNLFEDDNVNGIIVNFRDISDRKEYEQEIQHMAYLDFLTGLPNRIKFEHQLFEEMKKNNRIAVLTIDLDRFKIINDSMGHHVGDLVLIEVTKRIKSCLSEKDHLFRQGGDEFIIILTDVDRELVSVVSQKILSVLSYPLKMNHLDILTSPSIGISFFPDDGTTVEQITKNADYAMYQAKNIGRNTFHFYSPDDYKKISPLEMEIELHRAIDRNELLLHYQPKINLKTGKMVGVEALIRWQHPEWGLVSPGEFIPMAEESQLILSIGEWVLRTACKQNKIWQTKGITTVMAVNLSLRQFTQTNFVEMVEKILKQTGLEPLFLELEITESMTADVEQTIKTLKRLKAIGVKISIDDFGTGFSSLNYLKEFPVDTLKIDQSFIRELSNDSNGATIVKTIISMAHNLNLNVVAEGIETTEQLSFLQENFCNEGQGYFLSKPVQAMELEDHVQEIQQIVPKYGGPQ